MKVPEKPTLDGLEEKWDARWQADGVYRFDRSKARDQIYSVDTPPPTVSGSLHIGHVMSYTHTDVMVRFQRMRGKEPFYPMGWDDNGLPTERRVQNFYGVRCDPSLPYDEKFAPPADPPDPPMAISRPNFIELCSTLTVEDEKAMEHLWRKLGLSVDWQMTYTTIGSDARRISQKGFLRLLNSGLAYQTDAPTYWDVDFRSAVAQAELEDREVRGELHRVKFHGLDDDVEIETTRPELIASCVALVAHPEDERYRGRFGSHVASPLFGSRLKIHPHQLADPEKGTGIAMVCTFGDVTDVQWWRDLHLPTRSVVLTDGSFAQVVWGEDGWDAVDPARAQRHYNELVGLDTKRARKKVVEMLRESGDLVGEPQPITHPVKFYEKGDRPLEIVSSRQWYIRVLDYKEDFIRRGRQVKWHPDFMRVRYDDWVNGLNVDWGISRQRFFGVPFPVWYPINSDGTIDYENRMTPEEDELPVDPSTDSPRGFSEEDRGKPGGFFGDPDIMDTWATSSLTPQIVGGWETDEELFGKVFPMDLRPHAHDIIRTWLFTTVVRSHFEHDTAPWANAAISGFVTDPDRKKMSKSKGNVQITPLEYLTEFGSDGVRYWAGSARLGVDASEDSGQMKIGRRLATKILNASKFCLLTTEGHSRDGPVTSPLDRALCSTMGRLIQEVTPAFEDYEHARVLERVESFFWSFCDDYLELVKGRIYGGQGPEAQASAARALRLNLSAILRLFAPFLPYVTEEVWSWWQEGSIHKETWPSAEEFLLDSEPGEGLVLEAAAAALSEIRRAKSLAKVSLKAEVAQLVVEDTGERLAAVKEAEEDLRHAGNVRAIDYIPGDRLKVQVTLA